MFMAQQYGGRELMFMAQQYGGRELKWYRTKHSSENVLEEE